MNLAFESDAFADGQIGSKLWLCETLENLAELNKDPLVIWVLGGWYGILPFLLFSRARLPIQLIRSFDLDPQAQPTADLINNHWEIQEWRFKAFTQDVNQLDFASREFGPAPHLVINTSTEHFDSDLWWKRIPRGTYVALQGTDMKIEDHKNRVSSLDELRVRHQPMARELYGGV